MHNFRFLATAYHICTQCVCISQILASWLNIGLSLVPEIAIWTKDKTRAKSRDFLWVPYLNTGVYKGLLTFEYTDLALIYLFE